MNDGVYTIPEVAKYLKLSNSKVDDMVQRGKIPHIKIGKNVRIKEAALKTWLEKQENNVRKSFRPAVVFPYPLLEPLAQGCQVF